MLKDLMLQSENKNEPRENRDPSFLLDSDLLMIDFDFDMFEAEINTGFSSDSLSLIQMDKTGDQAFSNMRESPKVKESVDSQNFMSLDSVSKIFEGQELTQHEKLNEKPGLKGYTKFPERNEINNGSLDLRTQASQNLFEDYPSTLEPLSITKEPSKTKEIIKS